ncbi:sulfotransferase [Profundibacter sp.]|uniref:sulfotransferase n=1 Tax=Profundibacter sp. TaxID=3101071 RepID=UPI003D11B4C7
MIRSNQAGQAKNRPPRREEGENGNLQRFPFDLEAMAQIANMHQKYMAHWQALFPDRILTIGYEDIVADVEAASRKLADFCGVGWVKDMAHPERNTSAVRTASVGQVREGVHRRSVGGWERLKDQLQPFSDGLDKGLWPDLQARD